MKRIALFAAFMIAAALPNGAEAITACKLQQPDRDIRKFFPESTGYKTIVSSLKKADGEELLQEFEERLGDKLDKKYEAIDVEHTTYMVLKDEEPIGYVSGVNQKGQFGAMQVFTATDLEGKILTVSYQRVVSPHAKALKGKETLLQFKDLTLGDFYLNTKKAAALLPPNEKSAVDFKATVRAVRKNLIYSDIFNLNRKHDKQFLESKKGKLK
ncbi:MAG: hypothetical protein OXT69_02950 [Candidatus Poribacteria bacterium]|nr:hypothetical protein [Candidatus Poribacteria bacterium]